MRNDLIGLYLSPKLALRVGLVSAVSGALMSFVFNNFQPTWAMLIGALGGLIFIGLVFLIGGSLFRQRIRSDPIRQRYLSDMHGAVEEVLTAAERLPPGTLDAQQSSHVADVLLRTGMLTRLMEEALSLDGFGPDPVIDHTINLRIANILLTGARAYAAELVALVPKAVNQ